MPLKWENLMYGKPVLICFKYQVSLSAYGTITYLKSTLELGQMRLVDWSYARHLLNFSSPFYKVKFLHDYGLCFNLKIVYNYGHWQVYVLQLLFLKLRTPKVVNDKKKHNSSCVFVFCRAPQFRPGYNPE